jgi:hypothetical protein
MTEVKELSVKFEIHSVGISLQRLWPFITLCLRTSGVVHPSRTMLFYHYLFRFLSLYNLSAVS